MLDATPLLRLYARYRLAYLRRSSPAATQRATLASLLSRAANSRFGRDYDFSSISSVEEYQKRVPLRFYEQFWKEYWEGSFPNFKGASWPNSSRFIPVSSGTTSGTTKWIPYTREMRNSNTKAGLDLLVHHLNNCPSSRIFGGKSFVLGGSTDLVERGAGFYSGDLSGIVAHELPWWARARYFPPNEIAMLKNWEEKIELLARSALAEDIRLISGVPSWLLIFFKKLFEIRPDAEQRLCNLFPNLQMLVHGGVSFSPYQAQFRELLAGSNAEMREVYPASEGFIALADRGYGEGLRMILDHGIFFEFVPLEELNSPNPSRHWIGTIERDINYALVLTTCAGLWSYIIGDTVRFVDTVIPRLLITGRTSYFLSAFGEHLIGEEIDDGISTGARAIGATISDYSVGAIYPENTKELGGHLYFVEFSGAQPSPDQLKAFIETLDRRLCERNEDYDAHRAKDFGLRPPALVAVPSGCFAAWMKQRGKLGGQNKVPRIIGNPELFQNLRVFVEQYRHQ